MSEHADLLEQLESGVFERNAEATRIALAGAVSGVFPPGPLLEALSKGIERARVHFRQGIYALPDFLLAIDAYRLGAEFLKRHQPLRQADIVIGVVEGDVHDMGKNIVAAVLEASGYAVHDTGKNVSNDQFLDRIDKTGAKVLALSSMMSTPLANVRELVRTVRKRYPETVVIIGGAAFDADLARDIGADGYAENAIAVPEETRRLLAGTGSPVREDPAS